MRDVIPFTDKVREDLVLLNVEGTTRREVLENIAFILQEKGIVKEGFCDALLSREAMYPTGLPLGNLNIAIPHTNPEWINEIAVTIAVPRQPIPFHNMGDPDEELMVSIIVCLTLEKMDDNIKMLPSLMDFFAVEENLKYILDCRESSQIMEFLKKQSAVK